MVIIAIWGGKISEQIRAQTRVQEKSEGASRESLKRMHERIDKLERSVISDNGQTVFVARTECLERNQNVNKFIAELKNEICRHLDKLEGHLNLAKAEREETHKVILTLSEKIIRLEVAGER